MTRTIQLLNTDRVATVDDADYEALSARKWRLMKTHTPGKFYAQASATSAAGKPITLLMHRVIMDAQKGQVVDHEDNDGLMNTRSNLRNSTYSQNAVNSGSRGGTSVYKGVCRTKGGRWTAQIGHDKKTYHLGTYDTEVDAAVAYDIAATKYYGELSKTNAALGLLPEFVDWTDGDNEIFAPASLSAEVPQVTSAKVYTFPNHRVRDPLRSREGFGGLRKVLRQLNPFRMAA